MTDQSQSNTARQHADALKKAAKESAEFHWPPTKQPDAWRDWAHINTKDAFSDGAEWALKHSPKVNALLVALEDIQFCRGGIFTDEQGLERALVIAKKALRDWVES